MHILILFFLFFFKESASLTILTSSVLIYFSLSTFSPLMRSLIVISSTLHNSGNKDKSGIHFPVSHFDTDLSLTPSFSPSSA